MATGTLHFIEVDMGSIYRFRRKTVDISSRIFGAAPLKGYVGDLSNLDTHDALIQDYIGEKGIITKIAKDVIGRRASSSATYLKRSGELVRGFGILTFYNGIKCFEWTQPTNPQRNSSAKSQAKSRWSNGRWHTMRDSLFYGEERDTTFTLDQIKNAVYPNIKHDGMVVVVFNKKSYAAILNRGNNYNSLSNGNNRSYKILENVIESELNNRILPFGAKGVAKKDVQYVQI